MYVWCVVLKLVEPENQKSIAHKNATDNDQQSILVFLIHVQFVALNSKELE
jgi:hypothetical protein